MVFIDSHTHMGLNPSRGQWHGDFELPNLVRAVEPKRTGLVDLLLSPYGRWMAGQYGAGFAQQARDEGHVDELAWAREDPGAFARSWAEAWPRLRSMGYFT